MLQSLLVKLESPHPPEAFSPPGSPGVHHLQNDDVPDSPTPNCGWSVLPETPSTSEGAGFYLMFCCQCVPVDKDHPVITCVEYSSKYGMLVSVWCSLCTCVCVCVRACVHACVCACEPA